MTWGGGWGGRMVMGAALASVVLPPDASAQGGIVSRAPVAIARPSARTPVVLPTSTAATVRVATTATALSVVKVLVPTSLPARVRVTFTVTPAMPGSVVGTLTGAIPPGAGERSILLAVRSPGSALAGDVQVATVRFSTGTAAAVVPIVAQVGTTRGFTLVPNSRFMAGRAGTAVTIGVRLTNAGNARDTVMLTVVTPVGWRVPDGPAMLVLGAREAVNRTVTVLPPPAATGTASLRVLAMARGEPVADAEVTVQLASTLVAAQADGPTVTLGMAAAAGPWPGVTAVETLELSGPVTGGILLLLRGSTQPSLPSANYAFSRASVASTPFVAQLAGSGWRADAGTIGASLSNLGGVNLVGRGASASVTHGALAATAIAVSPDVGAGDTDGSLAGARLEFTPGTFTVSTVVSRLRERRGPAMRGLDAWTLGVRRDDVLGGRLSSEVARRQFGDGAGAGWSGAWERRTPDDNLTVRAGHAPGGTAAFARAASEFVVDGGRRLSPRLQVTGGAWRTGDGGQGTLSALSMEGWSLGAHYRARQDVQVSLDAHRSAFGASTAIGSFGSAERVLNASVELRQGARVSEVTVSGALLRRYGVLDGESTRLAQDAPRTGVRAMTGIAGSRMKVEATAQYERTGAGVGAAPVQWSYGLQVAGTPVDGGPRFDAAAERMGGSMNVARAMMLRAAIDVPLPFAALRISAERNPWILPVAGGTPWMYVVGFTRSVRLPRLAPAGTHGVVYRDDNGNGRRDVGEPGLAGVALRRGAEFAVTDDRGVFVLAGNASDTYEVDARTLPMGLITPATTMAPSTRAIGAVAVQPLTIELLLDPADQGRVTGDMLRDVEVIARDDAGHEWLARRTSGTSAIFDALPPGTYAIDVDATAVREPLRMAASPAPVRIRAGSAPAPVRITMRPRQLRFSTPGRGQ